MKRWSLVKPTTQGACPPRTVAGWKVSNLPWVAVALPQVASTLTPTKIGPWVASHERQLVKFFCKLKYAAMRRVANVAKNVFSSPRYMLVAMWKGSKASGAAPYLRSMSMLALRVVPAPSMKVSGREVNVSVSLHAIHVQRGDNFSVLASLPALTK